MRLPENIDLSLAVPAQRVAPEQERRGVPAETAAAAAAAPAAAAEATAPVRAEVPAQGPGTRPVWSLRAIFRNHPFPPVPGIRPSSLSQDEEASR